MYAFKIGIWMRALTTATASFPTIRDNKTKADNMDDADYDVAARELAFEGKGAAVDRTLGPEEFAERERQVGCTCGGIVP